MSVAGPIDSLPLPDDPTLAIWDSVLNQAGYWAYVFDASWRLVYVTDDLRLALGDTGPTSTVPLGCHILSAEARRWQRATRPPSRCAMSSTHNCRSAPCSNWARLSGTRHGPPTRLTDGSRLDGVGPPSCHECALFKTCS